MTKLIITKTDGSKIEMNYEDVSMVEVQTEAMKTTITPPNRDMYLAGNVHTLVFLNKLPHNHNLPDVSLTVGEVDSVGFKNRTDAMMYVSYNGRILAKNMTLGYANTEKPISTKPWIRGR